MALSAQFIINRIQAANFPRKVFVDSLDISGLKDDGHGTLVMKMHARRKSCFQQVYINPVMAKSLVSGKPNSNLDNVLRL